MFRCTISGSAISTLTFNRVSTPIADVFPVAAFLLDRGHGFQDKSGLNESIGIRYFCLSTFPLLASM
jgi:hypothetical protein